MQPESILARDLLVFSYHGTDHDLKKWLIPDGAKVTHIRSAIEPASKAGGSLHFRLYRRFLRLDSLGIVSLYKGVSGDIPYEKPGWYAAPTVQLLDLIGQVQNSNHCKQAAKKDEIDPLYRIPQRCRPERIEAIKRLMRIQDYNLFVRIPKPGIENPDPNNWEHWILKPELVSKLWDIDAHYEDYSEEVKDRKILFRAKNPAFNDVLTLPYRTRFTDDHRKIAALREFESAWVKASLQYRSAVFLTLTSAPPSRSRPSLWHANRHFGKAWNRYTSLLARRKFKNELHILKDAGYSTDEIEKLLEEREMGKGNRPIYIACYEFQKNGLLHSHVVIFGIRYLERKDKISKDWERCGQGRTVDICALKNDNGTWNWRKEKPKDAEGVPPETYLKKYLKKALFGESGFSLYWSVNKRFFTMSQRLRTPKDKVPPTGFWKCLGSWKENDIPLWVYEANRGAPVLADWGGWEIIKSHSQGEPAC